MYKEEQKQALKQIWSSTRNINEELTNIKVAMHDLEKLGYNVEELETLMTNVGIEFYKMKIHNEDMITDWRNNNNDK